MAKPPFSIRKTFNDTELAALLEEAEQSVTGTTAGPWYVRGEDGPHVPFVEAPEPSDRKFGYNIEILGEDDNGYPTRTKDAHFIAAARRLVPELANAVKQLKEQQKATEPSGPVTKFLKRFGL